MLQRLRTTALDESTLFFKSLSLLNNALSAMDVSALVVDSLKNVVENKLHFPIGQEEILLLLFFTCLKLSLDRNGTAKGIWCPYLGRVKEGKTSCLSLNTETSPRSLSCFNGAQNAHSVPDLQLRSLEETFQWLFFFPRGHKVGTFPPSACTKTHPKRVISNKCCVQEVIKS